MHSEIITTITTRIDLDTMTPTTSVHVECEDELPHSLIYAAVEGACKGVAKQMSERAGTDKLRAESADEDGEVTP